MDQCTHCELMGNYDGCKAADCGKHSDWIVREHKKRIRELEDALRQIADHPHNNCYGERAYRYEETQLDRDYIRGHEEGHRCVAAIASKALGRE